MKFILESIKQLFCAMRGHTDYMVIEDRRMYMKCHSCGYESVGFVIGKQK